MVKNIGLFQNLVSQLDKTARHNRQGSYKTRTRYFEACKRFCAFLADEFHLQKLANIAPKHIEAYAKFMQDKSLAASTVKTDLTAIRFFHDQIANAKHTLPGNDTLNLDRRKFGGVDRTWSKMELTRMMALCRNLGREDYLCIVCLGYYSALRIEETFRLGTAQAEAALKTGILTIKGKNGLMRSVPIQATIEIELKKMLEHTKRGQKLFVGKDEKTHLNIKQLQNFINYHRKEIQDPDSTRPLSFHGLRHTCAENWYKSLRNKGYSDSAARQQVSEWLGHHRLDITEIYLAGLKGDDGGV